jgi:hypothetical protein
MTCHTRTAVLAAATLSVGLIVSGCSKTAEKPAAPSRASSTASSSTSAAAQAPAGGTDLKSLVPTPANTTTTKGPDSIPDNGTHIYFQVNGAPTEVMDAFKAALEGKGWEVSAITSSGGQGGGGATYTGTHGNAFGVFDGGGYQSNTYIDVCTWPTKPANPNCRRGER